MKIIDLNKENKELIEQAATIYMKVLRIYRSMVDYGVSPGRSV